MRKTLSFRVKEEVMKLQGFKSLPHRWIVHTGTLEQYWPQKKFDLSIKLTSDQIIFWQAPATQPPPQGKINIGTMDVSDSDSDEEGQVSQVALLSLKLVEQFYKIEIVRLFMLGALPPQAM